ncbi:MAG TPA: TMEM143 family protein [Malonomonas sp.]
MPPETAEAPLEAFIPFRRSELIELCLADQQLDAAAAAQFKDFCQILAAFYHFRAHAQLERLKDHYSAFNPDSDNCPLHPPTAVQLQAAAQAIAGDFSSLLEKANYQSLSQQQLEQSFQVASLIPLQTKVDFDDFDQVLFYFRGEGKQDVTIKRLFRKKIISLDNFERVVVLLKFRDQSHFDNKQKQLDELGFVPGKMYLYLYKNIPKNDLELLFPNVEVSMNWKDRLLLVVPAVGAAIPLILKVLPSLGLLVAAVLLVTMGPEFAEKFGFKSDGSTSIYPLLVAVLSIGAALGGFAVRQYGKYKSKRLMFLKKVTDTLFFKNLVTNEGVLYSLTDAAEEELCKEAILVYYHLLIASGPLDRLQLDQKIESWMQQSFGTRIDFDIEKTLKNMLELQADLPGVEGGRQRTLLSRKSDGSLQVLPLDEAKRLIDYIWDHAFEYANDKTG